MIENYTTARKTDLHQKQRMRALVRDDFHCRMPGCKVTMLHRLEVHHLLPLEDGGTHDLANLITLCGRHHTAVHAKRGGPALFRAMITNP